MGQKYVDCMGWEGAVESHAVVVTKQRVQSGERESKMLCSYKNQALLRERAWRPHCSYGVIVI